MNRIDEALAYIDSHHALISAMSEAALTVDVDSPVAAAFRKASELAGELYRKVEPLLREVERAAEGIDCDAAVEGATRDPETTASATEGDDCDDEVWPGWWEFAPHEWRLRGTRHIYVTLARSRWFAFGVHRNDGSTEPFGGTGYATAREAQLAVQRALVGGAK